MLGLLSQGPPDLLSLTSPDFNWSLAKQHNACTSFTLPTWCMHFLDFTNMVHALTLPTWCMHFLHFTNTVHAIPSLYQHEACTSFSLPTWCVHFLHFVPPFADVHMRSLCPLSGSQLWSDVVFFLVVVFSCGGLCVMDFFQSQVSPAMSQWVHSSKLVQEWLVRVSNVRDYEHPPGINWGYCFRIKRKARSHPLVIMGVKKQKCKVEIEYLGLI